MERGNVADVALWPLATPHAVGVAILHGNGTITFSDGRKIRYGQPFRLRYGDEVWSADRAYPQSRTWRVACCRDDGETDHGFVYEPTRLRWSRCCPAQVLRPTWGYNWLRPLPSGSLHCNGQLFHATQAVPSQRRNGVSLAKAAGLGRPIKFTPAISGYRAILFQHGRWLGILADPTNSQHSRWPSAPPISYLPNEDTGVTELRLCPEGGIQIGSQRFAQSEALLPRSAGNWIVSKGAGWGEELCLAQPLLAATYVFAFLDGCWCQKFRWRPLGELLLDGALAFYQQKIVVGPAFSAFASNKRIFVQGLFRGQAYLLKKQSGEEQVLEFRVAGVEPRYFVVWRGQPFELVANQRPDEDPPPRGWCPETSAIPARWPAPWEATGQWCDWLDPRFDLVQFAPWKGLAVRQLPSVRLFWLGWIRAGRTHRWPVHGDTVSYPGACLHYRRHGLCRYLTVGLQRADSDEDGHMDWEFHHFRRCVGHWQRLVRPRTWREWFCLSVGLRLILSAAALRLAAALYDRWDQLDFKWTELMQNWWR